MAVSTPGVLSLLVHRDNLKTGSNPEGEGWTNTEQVITATGGYFEVFAKQHDIGNFRLTTGGPWPYILMSEGIIEVKKD